MWQMFFEDVYMWIPLPMRLIQIMHVCVHTHIYLYMSQRVLQLSPLGLYCYCARTHPPIVGV